MLYNAFHLFCKELHCGKLLRGVLFVVMLHLPVIIRFDTWAYYFTKKKFPFQIFIPKTLILYFIIGKEKYQGLIWVTFGYPDETFV